MSFAADLKDFASNFRDTYKVLHESGKDELAREQAAYLREQRDASARGEATFQGARNIDGLNTPDQRYTPAEGGLNTSGKLPTFAKDPFDVAVRTVYGEAASQPPEGQQAVAATLVNRSKASGRSVAEEALKPNQYEPWNNPAARRRMLSLDPSSPTYQAIAERIRPVLEGKADPTRGATHFYAPKAQRALGRSTPSWATSGGFDIGDHRFYRLPYSGQGSHGIGKRAALDLEDPEDETAPVVYAATGGIIPSGWDRMNDTTESESAGSNPVTRDVMDTRRAGLTDEDYDPRSLVDIEGARQAVAGGLKFGQRLLGLETHHAAVPEAAQVNPDGVTALQTNAGAPPREQIQMIHQTVDPKGELPPELRDIAGYNALQRFWTARGEPQKADAAAWNMLQSAKKAVSQYGAMALSIDDPVKRAQLIAKAHNEYLPDGEVMKITGKSGNGAKFELFNNKGDLTEKGVLAMDDMVKMATGMHNGTAYLQTMVKFATDAPSAADKAAARKEAALERRRGALADYDEAAPDNDIVREQLTDKQKEILQRGDLDPSDRKNLMNEARQKLDMKRKQFNTEMKNTLTQERYDRSEDMKLFQTAVRLGMWDETRSQVMTMHEQKLAQLQAQEEGREGRFAESQDARRRRELEIDKRILNKRTKTLDGAGQKLTAKQRDAADVEDKRLAGEQAITSRSDVPEGTDVEGGPWTGPALAEERLGTARAQTGYAAAREQQAKLEGKSGVDPDATATAVTELWTKPKAEGGFEQKTPLTPKQKDTFTGLATGIASANHIPAEQAIRVAIDAANPSVPVRFRQDPTDPRSAMVQLGTHPPMRIGADTLNLIAMARGGELNPRRGVPDRTYRGSDYRTNPPPRATTALPGVTGNPTNAAAGGWVQRGLDEGARGAKARRRALELDMLESGQLNPMYRP